MSNAPELSETQAVFQTSQSTSDDDNKNDLPPQLIFMVLLHPIDYAKVLMQLGYEPVPPRESTTLLGRPTMILPNVFQYIKFIKSSDGFFGCYRGLSPRVLGLVASNQLTPKVLQACAIYLPEINTPPNIATDGEPKAEDYYKHGRRFIIMATTSTIISHPFQVVSIRMMASFIGKEEHYDSLLDAVVSVYTDNGVLGFFHGIIPKVLGDLTCAAVSYVLAFYVNKYWVKTKELRLKMTIPIIFGITSSFVYPFILVSTCMAVAGSSLKAGNPPMMPHYSFWPACCIDLLRNKQHFRGSSLFLRYYVDPVAAMQ